MPLMKLSTDFRDIHPDSSSEDNSGREGTRNGNNVKHRVLRRDNTLTFLQLSVNR